MSKFAPHAADCPCNGNALAAKLNSPRTSSAECHNTLSAAGWMDATVLGVMLEGALGRRLPRDGIYYRLHLFAGAIPLVGGCTRTFPNGNYVWKRWFRLNVEQVARIVAAYKARAVVYDLTGKPQRWAQFIK